MNGLEAGQTFLVACALLTHNLSQLCGPAGSVAALRDGHLFSAALLLPLVYLVDATLTLGRRMARGENPARAHREHVYQRAVIAGASHAASFPMLTKARAAKSSSPSSRGRTRQLNIASDATASSCGSGSRRVCGPGDERPKAQRVAARTLRSRWAQP